MIGREVVDVIDPHAHDEEVAVGQLEKNAVVEWGDSIPSCFENADEMVIEVAWCSSHAVQALDQLPVDILAVSISKF